MRPRMFPRTPASTPASSSRPWSSRGSSGMKSLRQPAENSKKRMICRVEQGMDQAVRLHNSADTGWRSEPSGKMRSLAAGRRRQHFFQGVARRRSAVEPAAHQRRLQQPLPFLFERPEPFSDCQGALQGRRGRQAAACADGRATIASPSASATAFPEESPRGRPSCILQFFEILGLIRRKFPTNLTVLHDQRDRCSTKPS